MGRSDRRARRTRSAGYATRVVVVHAWSGAISLPALAAPVSGRTSGFAAKHAGKDPREIQTVLILGDFRARLLGPRPEMPASRTQPSTQSETVPKIPGVNHQMFPATLKDGDRNAWKGEFRMELRHSLCCLLAAASAVSASASQRLQVKSDQQVLIELEQGWNEAFYRKDVAFIENILADEFMATYDDGSRGDKAKELALVAEFNQQVESAIQDEFTVRVYRDTAVVWFTLRLVGNKQGQRAELTLRYTDVWVMRDGRWLCVSSQSTRVTPK